MTLLSLSRPLAALTLLAGIALAAPAWAQSTPSQRVVAGCVGYGMGLADHLSGSPRNTPAHDQVFRPGREECLRRGGPESMPNGLMFAPFYSPDDNTGGPPTRYRLTPNEVGQGRVVLAGCDRYAFRKGDVVGNRNTVQWRNAAAMAWRECLLHVGARPDGSALLSPPLGKRAGGLAFATADDNDMTCNDLGCTFTVTASAWVDRFLTHILANPQPGGVPVGTGSPLPGDGGGGSLPTPEQVAAELARLKQVLSDGIKQCANQIIQSGGNPASGNGLAVCALAACIAQGIKSETCQRAVQQMQKVLNEAVGKLGAREGWKAFQNWVRTLFDAALLAEAWDIAWENPAFRIEVGIVAAGALFLCFSTGVCEVIIPALPVLKPFLAGGLTVSVTTKLDGGKSGEVYCRMIVNREMQKAGSAMIPAGIDSLVAFCLSNPEMPRPADYQRVMAAAVQRCDNAGQNALRVPASDQPVTAYSRAANVCMRGLAAPFARNGMVPELSGQLATAFTGLLKACAESVDLQWNDAGGAAVAMSGAPGVALVRFANCMKALPYRMQ